MKTLRSVIFGIALLLLTSCNTMSSWSRNANPLVLTLELEERNVHSFEDLHLQLSLLNQSNSRLLVQSLGWRPSAPKGMFAMTIMIWDSFGIPVDQIPVFVNGDFPGEDTMTVLGPGEQKKRPIDLSFGYSASKFKSGKVYTIVAYYQNDLDVTKSIDGVDVPSWVGSIRSNKVTFVILP